MGGLSTELRFRIRSFRFAFAGWWYVLRTQHNTWIHGAISIAVLVLAWWLRLSRQDWAILILAITVVWMGEFANTAVEALVDMTMPEPHPLAKVAKDVAAACVLIGALGAILVGLLILGAPLYERIK